MKLTILAKVGYLARAIVYFLMGCFAVLLIIGSPKGTETDSKGVLRELMEQPFGHFLLFILALGLFSYAVWRFAQSFLDVSYEGTSKKGIFRRIGFAIGGLTHTLLGVYAIKLIFSISAGAKTSEVGMARWLLNQPFGQILTGGLALAILGFGVSQLIMGWKNKFLNQLNLPEKYKSWLCPVCKFGFIARGFVFVLIGTFFFRAALHENSREAGGMLKAWKFLSQQPFGQFLTFLVAVGFIAFAFYGFAESKYQKQISV